VSESTKLWKMFRLVSDDVMVSVKMNNFYVLLGGL
jgi:hypothetical protein